MGGDASQGKPARSSQHPLRFKLDLPHLKLDLAANAESLPEVRRIIEAINDASQELGEDGLFDLKHRLTDEFLEHQPLVERLKNAALLDEDVRIVKRIIPYECEYDLESGESSRQVNALSVKEQVAALFDGLPGTIRACLLHIRGELSREQQCVIMDAVKQRLGMAVETRFFSTKKNLEGNILVEAVCFGEGIAETW